MKDDASYCEIFDGQAYLPFWLYERSKFRYKTVIKALVSVLCAVLVWAMVK